MARQPVENPPTDNCAQRVADGAYQKYQSQLSQPRSGLAGQGRQGWSQDGRIKSQADKKEIIAERAADGIVFGESA